MGWGVCSGREPLPENSLCPVLLKHPFGLVWVQNGRENSLAGEPEGPLEAIQSTPTPGQSNPKTSSSSSILLICHSWCSKMKCPQSPVERKNSL